MNATLAEILENQRTGLLWVSHDGLVRYANGDACSRTGLTAGSKLYDPDLIAAVAKAVLARTSATVVTPGRVTGPTKAISALTCRVVPGLAKDDAFIFLRDDVDANSGVAFDNLMQTIRVDLASPLRDAHQALSSMDGELPAQAGLLLQSVSDVMQVLDRLVDLASLWSGTAMTADDRIELWPLLQGVWAELQPQGTARKVRVRFQAQDEMANLATIYGSMPWIRRVFLECLEAAIQAAPAESTLLIEHRQFGPRALIVFRDSGVFSQNAEGVELAVSTRGTPRTSSAKAARERVGVQLCRQILALHGGQLRDEVEDGVRHLIIDLPTGAPYRAADSHTDIAQAQRYASDLAALMARSRRNAIKD